MATNFVPRSRGKSSAQLVILSILLLILILFNTQSVIAPVFTPEGTYCVNRSVAFNETAVVSIRFNDTVLLESAGVFEFTPMQAGQYMMVLGDSGYNFSARSCSLDLSENNISLISGSENSTIPSASEKIVLDKESYTVDEVVNIRFNISQTADSLSSLNNSRDSGVRGTAEFYFGHVNATMFIPPLPGDYVVWLETGGVIYNKSLSVSAKPNLGLGIYRELPEGAAPGSEVTVRLIVNSKGGYTNLTLIEIIPEGWLMVEPPATADPKPNGFEQFVPELSDNSVFIYSYTVRANDVGGKFLAIYDYLDNTSKISSSLGSSIKVSNSRGFFEANIDFTPDSQMTRHVGTGNTYTAKAVVRNTGASVTNFTTYFRLFFSPHDYRIKPKGACKIVNNATHNYLECPVEEFTANSTESFNFGFEPLRATEGLLDIEVIYDPPAVLAEANPQTEQSLLERMISLLEEITQQIGLLISRAASGLASGFNSITGQMTSEEKQAKQESQDIIVTKPIAALRDIDKFSEGVVTLDASESQFTSNCTFNFIISASASAKQGEIICSGQENSCRWDTILTEKICPGRCYAKVIVSNSQVSSVSNVVSTFVDNYVPEIKSLSPESGDILTELTGGVNCVAADDSELKYKIGVFYDGVWHTLCEQDTCEYDLTGVSDQYLKFRCVVKDMLHVNALVNDNILLRAEAPNLGSGSGGGSSGGSSGGGSSGGDGSGGDGSTVSPPQKIWVSTRLGIFTKVDDWANNTVVGIVDSKNRKIQQKASYFAESEQKKQVRISMKGSVKEIVLHDVKDKELSLGFEEIAVDKVKIDRREQVVKAFAIDPSNLDFSNGSIISIAQGSELWKCVAWNYSMQICMGNWAKVMDISPGEEYTFEFDKIDPGYAETGVATINTDKSRYHPNETVEITVVVLDKGGYLTDDATINAMATSPANITRFYSNSDGSLIRVKKGIYRAIYNDTLNEGSYGLFVGVSGQSVNYTMLSDFYVQAFYEFDILRTIPPTTDPWAGPFNSSVRIISYLPIDQFNFSEVLPINFTVQDKGGATESTEGDRKILTWNNLMNNSFISYLALPPLVSPMLYDIGPSYVRYWNETYYEAHPWYFPIDPSSGEAILAYGLSASNNPRYQIWDGSAVGGELSANSVGAAPAWVMLAANPRSEEMVMLTIDATPSLDTQVWNGRSWGANSELSTGVLQAYKGADIAYETLSGRALAVYRDGTNVPKYKIWNGSVWSSEASAQDTGSAVRWVELASDPNSNYIMLVTLDATKTNAHINEQVWNGTSWSRIAVREPTTGADRSVRCIDTVWSKNNFAFVVYGDNTRYVKVDMYNKTSNAWQSTGVTAMDTGNNGLLPQWIEIGASSLTDNMILLAMDDSRGLHASAWNSTSSSWGSTWTVVAGASTAAKRPFDVEFESLTGIGIIVFSANGDGFVHYKTWINGTVSGENTFGNTGTEQHWIELAANPDSNAMIAETIDNNNDMDAFAWDGSAWTSLGQFSSTGMDFTAKGIDVKFNRNATLAPSPTVWNIGNSTGDMVDYSNQSRGELIRAYAQWNRLINQSYAEHNGLSTMLNFSVSPPFSNDWTNYSFNTSDTNTINRLGLVNISIWAKTPASLWNRTSPALHFYLWSTVYVSSMNLTTYYTSPGDNITSNCIIQDYYLNTSIAGYNVSYYRNSTYLGSNLTQSSGLATFRWQQNNLGNYTITCNITSNLSSWHRASSTVYSLNSTLRVAAGVDTQNPVINSISDSPDPVPLNTNVTIIANVTDNVAVGVVRVLIQGSYYLMSPNGSQLWRYAYDTTGLAAGIYAYTVYANDTAGLNASPSGGTFTISSSLVAEVYTDKAIYVPSELVNITTNVSINSLPQNASVVSDVIRGNATTPWWNSSWNLRKPIYVNNTGTAKTNVSIRVNVTGLNGYVTNCANQLRVASSYKVEAQFNVLAGDDSNWCDIVFLGNISAGAVNEHNYDVYYNNTGGIGQNYSVIQNVTQVLFFEDYSGGLSNYSNPTGDWDLSAETLRGHDCNPSNIDTLSGLLDLSRWEFGTLTFYYSEASNLEASDCLNYGIYANGAWLTDTNVFCNDVGTTMLQQNVTLGSQYMYSDFRLRYTCSMFDANGEYVYIDNTSLTLSRSGNPDLDSSLGAGEVWIATSTNASIGSGGSWRFGWNSNNMASEIYSAVSLVSRSGYASAIDYSVFQLASVLPIINSVSDSPDPVPYSLNISIIANVTSGYSTIDKVWVSINNSNRIMAQNGTNLWRYSLNTSGWAAGLYLYTVYANDTAGYLATPFAGNLTINNNLSVRVSTDNSLYSQSDTVIVTTNITVVSFGQDAIAFSDIISGNGTNPWWNSSWKLRKPIFLNNTGAAKTNVSIRVNVTGLNGNITNCSRQIRVASWNKVTQEVNVLTGDNSNWCDIVFLGDVSASAINEHNYDVYYNNTAAAAPGYANFSQTGNASITSRIGSADRWITGNSTASTGSSGIWSWSFSTSGFSLGLYIVTSFANRSGFSPGYNYTTFTVVGNTPPEATLNLPFDGMISSNTTVIFNCSATDDTGLKNVTLYGNWSTGWHANQTKSIGGLINSTLFNKTLANGNYTWNCRVFDQNASSSWATSNFTFLIDTLAPNVTLITPAPGGFSNSSVIMFIYNVTDANTITSCYFKLDGMIIENRTSISRIVNQSFEESLQNGMHNWTVGCVDIAGLTAEAVNRSINVSAAPTVWGTRWYETSAFSCSGSSCNISLSNARDPTENSITTPSIPSGSSYTLVNAFSTYVDTNGVLIPANTLITFSGEFLSNPANKGKINWYLYHVLNGVDYQICNSTGNSLLTTATSTCSSPSSALLLQSTEKLKLVVTVNNDYTDAITVYHYWDNLRLSYVDFGSFTSSGTLTVDLSAPATNVVVNQTQTYTQSCNVSCSGGTCYNVNVYAQYNTSATAWSNIGGSGNIVLNGTETNPHSLGAVNSSMATQTTSFVIKGDTVSSNNIRCYALSTYSNSTGSTIRQVNVIDATAPQVTLSQPGNRSWNNTGNFTFLFTVNENTNLSNCSLILNASVYQVKNSTQLINPGQNNFTVSGLGSGTYNWTVNCTDTSGYTGTASPYFVYVDRVIPTIILGVPAANATTSTDVQFSYNVSDIALVSSLRCNLMLNGTVNSSNYPAQNGNWTYITVTGLGLGTYFWNVSCWDNATNMNTSETRNFTVSVVAPTVALDSPGDNNWTMLRNLTFFFNVSEDHQLANCSLMLDGLKNASKNNAQLTNPGQNNFSVQWITDGSHNWTVNCSDVDNLTATPQVRTFYVDTSQPSVSLSYPDPDSNLSSGTIGFQFRANDSVAPNTTCTLRIDTINQTGYTNVIVQRGSLMTWTKANISDSVHIWNISCTDFVGNTNSSQRSFNVSERPSVVLGNPAPGSWNSDYVLFTFNVIDNDGLNNCTFFLDGRINDTLSTPDLVQGYNEFEAFSITEGTNHTWSVLCNDSGAYHNYNQTLNRTFHVDKTKPSIQLNSPGDGSNWSTSSVVLNFTAVDNLANSLSCNITINGMINRTNLPANNGSAYNVTISGLANGPYYWNVTCSDLVGLANTSATRVFNVYNAPYVNLTSPTNRSYDMDGNVSFMFYVSDSLGINNCTLIIDRNRDLVLNGSNISNGAQNTINKTGLGEGVHNWSINCTDTYRLETSSQTFLLYVDMTSPSVVRFLPQNSNTYGSHNVSFYWNVTDNFATGQNELGCNISIIGPMSAGQNYLNLTSGIASNITFILSDGNYDWNLTCWDIIGNINRTGSMNFTVIAPATVELTSPAEGYWSNSSNMSFAYIPRDDFGLRYCNLSIDGSYVTYDNEVEKNLQNIFAGITVSEGRHNWTVSCTDSDYNTNVPAPRILYVDLTKPNIQLNGPNNGAPSNSSSVMFNFTAFDNLATNMICNVTIDGQVNATIIPSLNASAYNFTVSLLNDSWHYWNVTCWDNATNMNTSQNRNFSVQEPPKVYLSSPQNYYRGNSVNLTLFYYATDNSGALRNCTLILNNTRNATNTSVGSGLLTNFTVYSLRDGNYTWDVNCSDPNGNTAINGSPRTFYVDTAPPVVALNFPTPAYLFSLNDASFNWTATDFAGTTITCNLSVSDSTGPKNSSGLTRTSGQEFTATLYNMSDGVHWWNVTCADDLGNWNTTQSFNFTVNKPDLLTNATRFYLNNTNPNLMENITLFLNMSNIGGSLASNVLVEFWDGLPGTGTLIGNETMSSIAPNSTALFSTTWLITSGYHTLWARIDPKDIVAELNESNNNATLNISVLWANITLPLNDSWRSNGTVGFNFTMRDYTGRQINYTIYVDGAANGQTGNSTDSVPKLLNVTLNEGIRYVIAQTTDYLGRNKNSSAVLVKVDLTGPNATFMTLNNSWFGNSTPIIWFNITDNLDLVLNYTLYVNGTAETNGSVGNNTPISYTLNNHVNGTYSIIIQSFDDAGNYRNSTVLIIRIDTVKPSILLRFPPEGYNASRSTIELNFSVTDNMATDLLCNLTLNNSVIRSNIAASAGSEVNTTVSGLGVATYYWNVTCWDSAGNINTSETRSFSLRLADLSLNSSDIMVNESSFIEDHSVTINATVHNTGAGTATNLTVQFFDGDWVNGTQIGSNQTILSIGSGEQRTVNVSYVTRMGTRTIYVVVDPPLATNGIIEELNESNNYAILIMTVGSYELLNGNLSGILALYDRTNLSIISWNVSNRTNSNIFVADSDSIILWTDLVSLTRNTSGALRMDDLVEADRALNMSNNTDSLNATWTFNGVNRLMMNWTIYGETMADVPTINSTNTTNFLTGILWDASDQNNGEYNGTQDLVFLTTANSNKMGRYGTYDYELRIPANLRMYKTPNSVNSVTIYVELK